MSLWEVLVTVYQLYIRNAIVGMRDNFAVLFTALVLVLASFSALI